MTSNLSSFTFVGRQNLLNEFYQLFSYRQQKNVLYIKGPGGFGKTWLLRQIKKDNPFRFRYICDLIDFYELKHQTISGLREAIMAQLSLNQNFFEHYRTAVAEYEHVRSQPETPASLITAAEQEIDYFFFRGMRAALADREVVLLFDTFEMAQDKAVGAWFLEEFLENAEGAVIVMVGREQPLSPFIPYRVVTRKIGPFNETDTAQYCQLLSRKYQSGPLSEPDIMRLYQRVEGVTLKIELFYENRTLKPQDLEGLSADALNRKLMEPFSNPNLPLNRLQHLMAFLRRRFNQEILKVLQEAGLIESSFEDARILLFQPAGWIKQLIGAEENFVLHDVFRELLLNFAMAPLFSPEDPFGQQAFELIVNGWYQQKINDPAIDHELRRLLIAERVGYILDRDAIIYERKPKSARGSFEATEGVKEYEVYFQQAIEQKDFHLAELLFSEIFKYRQLCTEGGYHLCRRRADWLYESGQLTEAANLYRLMAHEFDERPPAETLIHRLYSLVSLSDVFLARGKRFNPSRLPKEAQGPQQTQRVQATDYLQLNNAYDAALKGQLESQRLNDTVYEALFLNRQGIALAQLGRWAWAQALYQQALNKLKGNPSERARKFRAQTLLSQSELLARLGDYVPAENAAEAALQIRRELLRKDLESEPDRERKPIVRRKHAHEIADALVYKAQALRYANRPYTAHDLYEKARHEIDEGHVENKAFLCNFRQSQGANFYAIGVRKRVETDDLADDFKNQLAAADNLQEALVLARTSKLRPNRPPAFRRLGRVIEEMVLLNNRLQEIERQQLESPETIEQLRHLAKELQQRCKAFSLLEEKVWLDAGKLIEKKGFDELDDLGRVQRLFEVSFLEADQLDRYHESLDSLQEAAHIARLRERWSDIEHYAGQVKYLRGYDIQEDLFSALIELTRADALFDQGQFKATLDSYCQYFPVLGEEGGYGAIQWKGRLREMEAKLKKANIEREEKVNLCEELIGCWENRRVNAKSPEARKGLDDMIDRVRGIVHVLQSLSEE